MRAFVPQTADRPYDVSLIIPFYNERENLAELIAEVVSAMTDTGRTFEVLLIDDGSRDGGAEVAMALAREDHRLKLIQLTRNFGQTAALSAGFAHARGRIYIPVDADGQNDPADIPKLLAKLEEGADVVSGWRRLRRDAWLQRRLPSSIANWFISWITGVKLHDYGCSLKAYRAEFIDTIDLYGEMHRFIPAFASAVGGRVVEVVVNHRPRTHGVSKYDLTRTFKVLVDLLTVKFLSRFSTKPAYLFGGVGAVLCVSGLVSAGEVIVEKYSAGTFAHRNPFLLLAVFLFILGVQFMLMGLIAELLVRTYHESQGKTIYLVKRTVNL